MTEHTPGPWTVEDPFGPDNLAIVPAGKPTHEWVIIATCSYDEVDEPRPVITVAERDANARLIAAAPDLLSALLSIACAVEHPSFDNDRAATDRRDAAKRAREVIAKATGGSK